MSTTQFYLIAFAVNLTFSVFCFMKGKFWMGGITLIIGGWLVSIFGATRLAKPDSYWAQRFYDPTKMSRARTRFLGTPKGEYVPPPVAEMFR